MKSISASTHLKPFSRVAAFYLFIGLISSLLVSGVVSLFPLDYYQTKSVEKLRSDVDSLLFTLSQQNVLLNKQQASCSLNRADLAKLSQQKDDNIRSISIIDSSGSNCLQSDRVIPLEVVSALHVAAQNQIHYRYVDGTIYHSQINASGELIIIELDTNRVLDSGKLGFNRNKLTFDLLIDGDSMFSVSESERSAITLRRIDIPQHNTILLSYTTLGMVLTYYVYTLLFIAPLFFICSFTLACIVTIKQGRQFFNVELSRGLSKEQLFPVFQPIVDSRTGEITAAELLARWKHPELGFVELEQFIPLMEKNKQLNSLVSDFFDKAAEMLPNQTKLNYLSINITPSQIRDTAQFLSLIRILNQHRRIASKIMLELTEKATDLSYDKRFINRLNQLQSMGFHIALDDFGTGQNGLELLRRFRPDVIKIDKSYVDLIGKDVEKLSILEAIIDIATKMEITLIAEGVENIEQNNYLSNLGVFNIQGFHYFRPLFEDVFLNQLGLGRKYEKLLLN